MTYITNNLFNSAMAVLVLAGLSLPLHAEETTPSRITKSISYANNLEKNITVRKAELEQAETDVKAALVKQGFRTESLPVGAHVDSESYHYGGDITLYDATTTLISDFDDDGFYHRFSVGIDADTVYSTAWVYAELYLSYEGGPWNHYATSSAFHIHGDSELDVFVVETELAEGFPAGYYDVRIELYDADTDEWLLNYGPYDDASLSTLPLEDSVYDDDYYSTGYSTEVIVAGHGGLSLWLLAVIGLMGVFRRTVNRSTVPITGEEYLYSRRLVAETCKDTGSPRPRG